MSACVGVDLSSFAIDLVKLDETSNRAEWVRCELHGKDAWERTLGLGITTGPTGKVAWVSGEWFEDVYLVALEAPYGRGQAGTNAILNRVVGAIAASLPARLRVPERCWIVRPDEWKKGLGLKGKPTHGDLERIVPDVDWYADTPRQIAREQNARDAYCLAMFARDSNAEGVAAA